MLDRNIRVSELLKQEISNMILFGEIKDPRVAHVLITRVDVSKDLTNAKIFFRTYEDEDIKNIEETLNRASSFIRNRLFKKLRLKKAINLKFIYDDSQKYLDKIDEILRKIHGE